MAKQAYISKNFQPSSLELIDIANTIIEDYQARGFSLTLRQLYYQIVARGLFPDDRRWSWDERRKKWRKDPSGTKNADPNYKWLGGIINDARLAGYTDWDAIVDRTRNLAARQKWNNPKDIGMAAWRSYKRDRWEGQPYRPECFPPETMVLTPSGHVPISSIEAGDQVIGDNGTVCNVTKVYRKAYSGPLLTIKATGLLSFSCTPEHPFLTIPYDDSRPGQKGADRRFLERGWVNARCLKKFDLLHVPRGREVSDLESVHMKGGSRSRIIGNVAVDDDLLSVIGIYLAEGCVRSDRRTVQFTTHIDEVEQLEVVRRWGESVGAKVSTAEKENVRQIYLFSKAVCNWLLDNFGEGAFNKHIPCWFMQLPDNKKIITFRWYFAGDGAKAQDNSRSAITIGTRSEQMARQWQTTLISMGYRSSLHAVNDHGLPFYRIVVSGESGVNLARELGVSLPIKGVSRSRRYNHIRMTETHSLHPIKSITDTWYNGEVFNLEVQERHSYCVPAVAHNCWVEKEALAGIIQQACHPLDVDFISCRGYMSQSEMREAGERYLRYLDDGQTPIVIHLGDHDPSGMDMTRDIIDRLTLFMSGDVDVKRIALNYDQIEEYGPPPNPAKTTDSRSDVYISQFGKSSWELDALDPDVLVNLITETVLQYRDDEIYDEVMKREEEERSRIKVATDTILS